MNSVYEMYISYCALFNYLTRLMYMIVLPIDVFLGWYKVKSIRNA